MKKNYIVPCITIRVSRMRCIMIEGSPEITVNPESYNGGNGSGLSTNSLTSGGKGDGSDINSANQRGFGSDSPWESLW